MAEPLSLDDLVDRPKLDVWLADHVPALGDGPLSCSLLHGGTSNVIIAIDRGGTKLVLRRPPAVPPPNSEKAIMREARVLTALNGTDVPHPYVHATCEDLAVIGAPFYVMDRVEGWAAQLTDTDTLYPAPFDTMPYKHGVAYAMIDGLAALARVDYKAVGLEGFGKPEGFLERQVDRWLSQLKSYGPLYGYEQRPLPGFDYIVDWLRANTPRDFQPGIMHGDVGTPNALFADGPPARLTALIDWELSTIGDPMLDLVGFASGLIDERDGAVPPHTTFDPRDFPTRQTMAAYWASQTGRSIEHLDYYLVLSLFKGGCICEYKVAQAKIGLQSEWTDRFFTRLVHNIFAEAEKIARRAA